MENRVVPIRGSCGGCRNPEDLGFDLAMAFQPIVRISDRSVFAYEALVRGIDGEGAQTVLSRVGKQNLYLFDQMCRVKAIEQASQLGMKSRLSINFLPNAVRFVDVCIRLTLATAVRCGFPAEQIIFEVSEKEQSTDLVHLKNIFANYKHRGFTTAIDDFGAGFAGFNLLVEFIPDVIKIDMSILRNIDRHRERQIVVGGIVQICKQLGVQALAEGVETRGEFDFLRSLGIDLFQGYLFARPAFRALPEVNWQEPGH